MATKYFLISKNYPPQIGGIEKYSFDLYNRLLSEGSIVQIVIAKPRKEGFFSLKILSLFYYYLSEFLRLFIFFTIAVIKGCIFSIKYKNNFIIWSADASIGIIGIIIKFFTHSSGFTRLTCHGKDIAWNNFFYQKLLKFSLLNTDEIYVVSRGLKNIILNLGISEKKIFLHEHDVGNLAFSTAGNFDRESLLKKYNIPFDKILLFSIGRFVEKKGFHWFIYNVLPFLSYRFHYVLAGQGFLGDKIINIINKKGLSNVTLTGPIFDPIEKARLYSSMDYFVMPNIHVKGDYEGYGIVLLEAHHYGLRIIVSDADGLGERVGKNDFVLSAGNSKEWIRKINKIF